MQGIGTNNLSSLVQGPQTAQDITAIVRDNTLETSVTYYLFNIACALTDENREEKGWFYMKKLNLNEYPKGGVVWDYDDGLEAFIRYEASFDNDTTESTMGTLRLIQTDYDGNCLLMILNEDHTQWINPNPPEDSTDELSVLQAITVDYSDFLSDFWEGKVVTIPGTNTQIRRSDSDIEALS